VRSAGASGWSPDYTRKQLILADRMRAQWDPDVQLLYAEPVHTDCPAGMVNPDACPCGTTTWVDAGRCVMSKCVECPARYCKADGEVMVEGHMVKVDCMISSPGAASVSCPHGMVGTAVVKCHQGELHYSPEESTCEPVPSDVCDAFSVACGMEEPCENAEKSGYCDRVKNKDLCKRRKYGDKCKMTCELCA